MHLTQNSQVVAVEGAVLTLGFTNVGARDSFLNGGCDEILRQAAIDVAGVDWKVEAIVDPGASGGTPQPVAAAAAPAAAAPTDLDQAPDFARDDAPEPVAPPEPATEPEPAPPAARPGTDPESGAHRDDADADPDELGGAALLERELGAQVIEEIPHS